MDRDATDGTLPPLSPPRWLAPDRLALVAIAVAAGIAAPPALARIDVSLARETAPALVVCTALLSALLASRVLRARSVTGAVIGSILGGAGFGSLNAGLVMCVVGTAKGNLGAALLALLFGSIFGAILGAPLGLAFGAAFSPVLGAAVRVRQRPSHDALEPVLLACGGFLALVGAFAGWRHGMPYRHMGLGLVLGGLGCAALALARDVSRLAWVGAARAGRLSRYRIVPPCDDLPVTGLRPLIGATAGVPDGVLVRVPLEGAGAPFRTLHAMTPLALVHLRGGEELRAVRRRVVLTIAVLALGGLCAISPWMHAPSDPARGPHVMGSWD